MYLDYLSALPCWILFADRRPTLALGLLLCLASSMSVCCVPSNACFMNTSINTSAFDNVSIGLNLDIFYIWKNVVLQMLETWLSKERLLSNSSPTVGS